MATEGKSNTKKWILIGVGVVVLGIIVCCGGSFLFGRWAMSQAAEQLKDDAARNPVVQEHIGDIQDFDFSLVESGETGKPNTLVVDVVGSKGSGKLELTFTSAPGADGTIDIMDGTLTTSDGTVLDLVE